MEIEELNPSTVKTKKKPSIALGLNIIQKEQHYTDGTAEELVQIMKNFNYS